MTINTTRSLAAVVFPGQGSQTVGMLNEFVKAYPAIKQPFETASQMLGYDLWEIVATGPSSKLDQTAITQPALLTASYAMWQLMMESSAMRPSFLAGHSLGEYTALVCAEALDFKDAVRLVAARGEYMQAAVDSGVGLMAAIIGLDNDAVEAICKAAKENSNEVVSPANYNCIGQVVIAGHRNAVERAMTLAKSAGAKLVTALPVSVPSHCTLMKEAADRLRKKLNQTSFQQPAIPVVNNVDVQFYEHPEGIREGLVKQLVYPVRWVETVQYMAQAGVGTIMECGPGKVLTGLMKRIDKSLQLSTLSDLETFNHLQALSAERNT